MNELKNVLIGCSFVENDSRYSTTAFVNFRLRSDRTNEKRNPEFRAIILNIRRHELFSAFGNECELNFTSQSSDKRILIKKKKKNSSPLANTVIILKHYLRKSGTHGSVACKQYFTKRSITFHAGLSNPLTPVSNHQLQSPFIL